MPTLTTDPNVHYVKFLRGSTRAWQNLLQTPNRIDDDILYFIYEDAADPKTGKLYLGQKLISGAGSGSGDVINISDIGDVYINGSTLEDKQLLTYNEHSEQWENVSLSSIINDIKNEIGVFTGATDVTRGTSGLVPVPQPGDNTKYLKGDGTWSTINILPQFDTEIFTSKDNKITIANYNFAPIGSIPVKTDQGVVWSTSSTGALNMEIVTYEYLQNLVNNSTRPITSSILYLVDNGNDASSGNKYEEYMIIDGHIEQMGTFGEVNLRNYVTVPTFETAISTLEDILYDTTDDQTGEAVSGLISRVSYIENTYITKGELGDLNTLLLSEGNTTLVEEVNTINNNLTTLEERLKWQELQNEN